MTNEQINIFITEKLFKRHWHETDADNGFVMCKHKNCNERQLGWYNADYCKDYNDIADAKKELKRQGLYESFQYELFKKVVALPDNLLTLKPKIQAVAIVKVLKRIK